MVVFQLDKSNYHMCVTELEVDLECTCMNLFAYALNDLTNVCGSLMFNGVACTGWHRNC